MQLSDCKLPQRFLIPVTGLCAVMIFLTVFSFFSGKGDYQFLFWVWNKNVIATGFGVIVAGVYLRWCKLPTIPINHQAIQEFLGVQTGEVITEGKYHFTPKPFWDVEKIVSVEHFTFTVAAQNRTKEGYTVLVCATGKVRPFNVFHIAKLSREDLKEQVMATAMNFLGNQIRISPRSELLGYQAYDDQKFSRLFSSDLATAGLQGLYVGLMTTKMVEVDPNTFKQFETQAGLSNMQKIIADLKKQFPHFSDKELYATYASLAGLDPHIMSHIVSF